MGSGSDVLISPESLLRQSRVTSAQTVPVRQPSPSLATAIYHLFVLNAVVVAQPLMSQLADNPRYLLEMGITAGGLAGTVAGLLLIGPLGLTVLELLANRVGRRWQVNCHRVVVAGGFLLLGGQISRPLLESLTLRMLGLLDLSQLLFAIAFASVLTLCYCRTTWGPRLVSWAGCGLIVFPAAFFSSATVQSVLMPRKPVASVTIRDPKPVVLIVFDGLLGTALMDENRQIDAIRYPNFARLAQQATWFRNATTVHPRTDHAVPAILSGCIPVDGTTPVLASYPQNLLSLAFDSQAYEIISFEPYTRLTPEELELHPPRHSAVTQTRQMLWTLHQVLWKISLPANVAGALPALPLEWFSLSIDPVVSRDIRTGCIRYSWDRDRRLQVDHFIDCLTPGDRPRLWFGHLPLPHFPFLYFADETAYASEVGLELVLPGTQGELLEDWGPDELAVDQAWQRYLLQVGAADHALGRILDRLHEQNLYDDSLIVVTADHGYSFRPNQSQREPVTTNLPDLMPVPLLIKKPHQQAGALSKRNVETIDVLPTIAAEIGLELPAEVDGDPVFSGERARLRKTMQTRQGPIYLDGGFPRADESRMRMLRRFGSGSHDEFWSLSLRPQWTGRKVSEFLQLEPVAPLRVRLLLPLQKLPRTATYVPAYFHGQVLAPMVPNQSPYQFAISVNDEIRFVTRTYTDPEYQRDWTALLPETDLGDPQAQIKIWQIVDQNGEPALQRCDVQGM